MIQQVHTSYGVFDYFSVDHIGRHIAGGGFWDEQLRPWLDRVDGGTVIDAGANIGFFTVYLAKFRKVYVHAFEASPPVFELLVQNINMNCPQSAVGYDVALFDKEIEVAMMPPHPGWEEYAKLSDGRIDYERHWNGGALALSPVNNGDDRPYRMTTKTIDSFGIKNVKLIKCDVQGADLKALKGGRATIEKDKPLVLFEFEPAPSLLLGDTLEDYFTFFSHLGYRVSLIYENNGTQDYVAEFVGEGI